MRSLKLMSGENGQKWPKIEITQLANEREIPTTSKYPSKKSTKPKMVKQLGKWLMSQTGVRWGGWGASC